MDNKNYFPTYRCRLCGKTFSFPWDYLNNKDVVFDEIFFLKRNGQFKNCKQLKLIEHHECEDGSVGI